MHSCYIIFDCSYIHSSVNNETTNPKHEYGKGQPQKGGKFCLPSAYCLEVLLLPDAKQNSKVGKNIRSFAGKL